MKEKPTKYIAGNCKKCGRARIELWSDGKKICQKCHYNQDTNDYEEERYKYI